MILCIHVYWIIKKIKILLIIHLTFVKKYWLSHYQKFFRYLVNNKTISLSPFTVHSLKEKKILQIRFGTVTTYTKNKLKFINSCGVGDIFKSFYSMIQGFTKSGL